MSSTAMLNVRLDSSLKRAGDAVLEREHVSATELIRSLYRFLEQEQQIPDVCRQDVGRRTVEERRRAMRSLAGIAPLAPGEDLATLRTQRHERITLKRGESR